MRWVKLYNENNLSSFHYKTKKSYKITGIHIDYIKKLLNQRNNKFLSLEELNKKLKRQFKNYNITSQWLGKVLLDNHITRKKLEKVTFLKQDMEKKLIMIRKLNPFLIKLINIILKI